MLTKRPKAQVPTFVTHAYGPLFTGKEVGLRWVPSWTSNLAKGQCYKCIWSNDSNLGILQAHLQEVVKVWIYIT